MALFALPGRKDQVGKHRRRRVPGVQPDPVVGLQEYFPYNRITLRDLGAARFRHGLPVENQRVLREVDDERQTDGDGKRDLAKSGDHSPLHGSNLNGRGAPMQTKRVPVGDLQFGMYVAELDRPWTDTPFLFQGFVIASQKQLEALKKYCTTVLIDAERNALAEAPGVRHAGLRREGERRAGNRRPPAPPTAAAGL